MDPFPPDPDDQYAHYRKFVKKGEFKKAYRCLEKLIREIPGDAELYNQIISLCLFEMDDPARARPWLYRLTRLRSHWRDHAVLGQVEAHLGDIGKARESLRTATAMEKRQRTFADAKKNAGVLDMVKTDIERLSFRRDVQGHMGHADVRSALRKLAAKKRVPLTSVRLAGAEPLDPGQMSATGTVPAAVPSLFQSSVPVVPPLAVKKSVAPTAARLA